MIEIYLCDDEDAIHHQIQTALEWKIFVENYDMKVVCSAASAKEVLAPAEMFTLRTGEMVRHVPLRDILFFETASAAHHVFLHTSGSRMDFLGSLNELEIQLGNRFIRTHRAYLVAADKIEAVDLKQKRLWVGGHECLLSRTGRAELRKKMGGSQ